MEQQTLALTLQKEKNEKRKEKKWLKTKRRHTIHLQSHIYSVTTDVYAE